MLTQMCARRCSRLTSVPISDTISLPLLPLVPSPLSSPVGVGSRVFRGPGPPQRPKCSLAEPSPEITGGGRGHRSFGTRGWEDCWDCIQELLPGHRGPRVGRGLKFQIICSSVSVCPQGNTWPCLDLTALFVLLLMNLWILQMHFFDPNKSSRLQWRGWSNRRGLKSHF